MGNTTCRFVINALGKGGETYYTHCQNKSELKEWIEENKEKLIISELKVIDRKKNPFMKLIFPNR